MCASRLFYGKLRQSLGVPAGVDKGKKPLDPKVDLFAHLLVNVAEEGFDLHDGLGRFFDDVVEFEGEHVPMQMSLIDLPPLLQVQLQRVQFDRDTLQSWKSQAYVKFGETIYMDRYMENADPQKRARSKAIQQELDTCRERISLLTRGKVCEIFY
jgi:ubiquitin carboxyl-terminal hydrolase 25